MVNILMSSMSLGKKWGRIEFSEYIKSDSRVTIIAFPFFDREIESAEEWDIYFGNRESIFYRYFAQQLAFFGIPPKNIKWINYFKDTAKSAARKIKSSDVVLITDGIPKQMMKLLEKLELIEVLKNYNKILIGAGYGAVIQLLEYQVEPCVLWDFQYFRGMGIIDDIGLEIHFEEFDFKNVGLRKFIKEKKKPIYALHDDGAVIIDGDYIRIIGDVDVIRSEDDLEEGINTVKALLGN